MAMRHGLGRGLGALIRDGVDTAPPAPESEGRLTQAPIDRIHAGAHQPRRRFDAAALEELAQSIRRRGILQPLLVRRGEGDRLELIAGERRLRAAALAGLREAPVIVCDAPDDTALEIALVENLQREDLNRIEEADGYQLLIDRFGLTHEQVAERVGKSRSAVTNALRLRALPEVVKALVAEGALSAGHAKVLTGLTLADEQTALARRVVKADLSVRELERLVRRITRSPRTPRERRSDLPEGHLAALSDRLHNHFGAGVRIRPTHTLADGKRSKGAIEIDFYSNDDLDRILDIMGITLD